MPVCFLITVVRVQYILEIYCTTTTTTTTTYVETGDTRFSTSSSSLFRSVSSEQAEKKLLFIGRGEKGRKKKAACTTFDFPHQKRERERRKRRIRVMSVFVCGCVRRRRRKRRRRRRILLGWRRYYSQICTYSNYMYSSPTNIGIVRCTVSVATIVVVGAGVDIWVAMRFFSHYSNTCAGVLTLYKWYENHIATYH